MQRLFDDFRPVVATEVAFLNRGKGIDVPDVQSAIEKVYMEINRTNPTLEIVSVKDFGAKGDGISDDTEAIQNAINAVRNKGGIVFFPAGEYLISNSLKLYSRIQLIGSTFPLGTRIRAIGETPFDMIVSGLEGTGRIREVKIENLELQGGRIARRGISLVDCTYTKIQSSSIEDCTEYGIYFDLDISFIGYIDIENVFVHRCEVGLYLPGNACHVIGGAYNNCVKGVVIGRQADVVTLMDVDASSNRIGIEIQGRDVTLINCYHELNAVDVFITEEADRTNIHGGRMRSRDLGAVIDYGKNSNISFYGGASNDSKGAAGHANLIPNGDLSFWPEGENVPPLIPFVKDTNFNSITWSRTNDGFLRGVSSQSNAIVRLNLDFLIPWLKGKTVTGGMLIRGHKDNEVQTMPRRFRLHARHPVSGDSTVYGAYHSWINETFIKTESFTPIWARPIEIREDCETLEMSFEINRTGEGESTFDFAGFYLTIGHNIPSFKPNMLSSLNVVSSIPGAGIVTITPDGQKAYRIYVDNDGEIRTERVFPTD